MANMPHGGIQSLGVQMEAAGRNDAVIATEGKSERQQETEGNSDRQQEATRHQSKGVGTENTQKLGPPAPVPRPSPTPALAGARSQLCKPGEGG